MPRTVNIVQADSAFIDGLFDFFARYVQKVHSDEFICKAMKSNKGTSFIDIIGPNDIAYVIALFKNSKAMSDQDIQMRESGPAAMGNPEKKLKPLFTSRGGQKRTQGKSPWNKDVMIYFKIAEVKWEEIYNSEDDIKTLCNKWEEWITSKGKEMTVGDGTKKTFHYVMATWYDEETPESKKKNHDSEDEEGFGVGGGYSSDRGCSRHSIAW